jgi:hypothetical protein
MWTYDINKIADLLGTYTLAWLEGVDLEEEVKQKMFDTLLPYTKSVTENNILSIFNSFRNKRIETIKNALEKIKVEELS